MLALAFACLMMLAPSSADAGWSAPVTVSGAGSNTSQTRLAGGESGESWVIWKRDVGGFDVIQGTRVQPDGSQGPILTLSDPAANATDPVISTRADGSAVIGWLDTSAADDTVVTVAVSADGTVGPRTSRSVSAAGQPARDIAIAVADDGSAGVAWTRYDGSDWVVQAVDVAADGSSGAIHDISEPGSSAGQPAIAGVPPFGNTTDFTYRLVWPQGSGDEANIFSREIKVDGTTDEIYQVLWPRIPVAPGDPIGPGTGGDPQDVHIEYGSDNAMNVFWARTRTDYVINGVNDSFSHDTNSTAYDPADPLDTPYQNHAVEMIRATAGSVLSNAAPLAVEPVTPVVEGTPYNVRGFDMTKGFGGQPAMSWIHELNGGGVQVETGRIRNNGLYAGWLNASQVIPEAERAVIAANADESAVAGWSVPGAVPGQDELGWTRFSNSFWENYAPSGDFLYSADPGFVVADSGVSLGAFTATNAVNVSTSRISVFTDPGVNVDTDINFGRSNIGKASTRFINIRSSGETPVDVSSIALSGASAGSYSLSGTEACVATIASSVSCRFRVTFIPGSTAVQNAKVTVTSELGNTETNLTGSGLNRTRNRITASPKRKSVRRGKVVRIRVRAANVGGVASQSTRVCVRLNKRALKLGGNRCRSLGSLAAGASRNLNFRVRVTWRVRRGSRLPVTFLMRSGNTVVRQAVVRVGRRR